MKPLSAKKITPLLKAGSFFLFLLKIFVNLNVCQIIRVNDDFVFTSAVKIGENIVLIYFCNISALQETGGP